MCGIKYLRRIHSSSIRNRIRTMWLPSVVFVGLICASLLDSSNGLRVRRGKKWDSNKASTTTTERPVWKPKVNGTLALAKQKNIDPENIPADDEEFKNVWPDDYYDDYDFEHIRNMLQHGTFEGRLLKYHEQELADAKAERAGNQAGDKKPPKHDDDGM